MVKIYANCEKKRLFHLIDRAMAISISMMFARFGGVMGSITAAFLLENYCESTFYLSGSILLGNHFQDLFIVLFMLSNIDIYLYSYRSAGLFHSQYTQEG